jgi:hypothetical protein
VAKKHAISVRARTAAASKQENQNLLRELNRIDDDARQSADGAGAITRWHQQSFAMALRERVLWLSVLIGRHLRP